MPGRREDDDDDFWPFDSLGEVDGSGELPAAPPASAQPTSQLPTSQLPTPQPPTSQPPVSEPPVSEPPVSEPVAFEPVTQPLPYRPPAPPEVSSLPVDPPAPAPAVPAPPQPDGYEPAGVQSSPASTPAWSPTLTFRSAASPEDVDRPIRRPPPRRAVPTAPRARSVAPQPSAKRPPIEVVRRHRRALHALVEHRRLLDVGLVLLALVVVVLAVLALQG